MPDEVFAVAAGEEGAVYVYYGGSSFPRGDDATSKCPQFSLVKPCPADVVIFIPALWWTGFSFLMHLCNNNNNSNGHF